MAVISNLNTQQTPVASGTTGTQVVRFIDAPRVYIKAVDSSPAPVTTKSNGATPSGYTDLGIVEGKVKVVYTKNVKEVRTGLDNVLRAVYIDKTTGQFTFTLGQFDDVVIGAVSGISPSTSGSVYAQYAMGNEGIIQKALLMVLQNKLDGKEWQFYHPDAYLSFNIKDSGDQTVVECQGDLPFFTISGSTQAIMYQTIFS